MSATPSSQLSKISFDKNQLAALKRKAAQERPYAQRLSTGLSIRLLTTAKLDAPYVVEAIDVLEGLGRRSGVKKCGQFKHAPLHPLWHQHFYAPRHMYRNIGERWGIAQGSGNKDLDEMIAQVLRDYGQDPDLWPKALVWRFAHGYLERATEKRLTGDWIVYAEHEGIRYYLDLATHEEGEPGEAEHLLIKLRHSALAEFPFVFEP